MADETNGLRCRNCGNTGISPWTGEPCGCPAGKALAHLAPQRQAKLDETAQGHVAHLYKNQMWLKEHFEQAGISVVEIQDMSTEAQPRAIVRHFAAAMERKLAANDATKGGWRAANGQANMRRWKALQHLKALRAEVDELAEALIAMDSLRSEVNAKQAQDILME